MTQPVDFQTYLAQTFQAAQPGPGAPPAGPVMLGGPPPPPPPMDVPPPPAPAPGPPPAAAAPPPQAPPPQPQGQPIDPLRGFPLVRVGSGVANVPEREVDLRGPTLKGAQGRANEAVGQAVQNVGDRNTEAAAHEYGVYLEQERSAKLREDAMMRAQAEREEEMQQRQQDFDTSVKSLSKASVDPDRFWASRSTGQKVASMVSVFFGGFLRGAHGGSNAGLDMINTAIDRDIKAQEFAYSAQRDAANARQTAFGMAMQKYNNADAARAMARAAALDAVQAQLGQTKALYAGTDAANRADMAMAQLENDKMNQIAQGVRFIPSQQVAVGAWVDPRTGLRYTDAEAKGVSKEYDGREFTREKEGLETAGKVIVESTKAQAAGAKDVRAQLVTLPNGDTVRAPSDAEAGKLRELAVSMQAMKDLANEAKRIRSAGTWRANPSERARLKQIQADMVTQFGVQNKLGALSEADMTLAVEGTADLFNFGNGVEARLERSMQKSDGAIRRYVRTFPDAPGSAKGEMPASFKAAGGK